MIKGYEMINLPFVRNRIFNASYYHSWDVVHRPDFFFIIKLRPSIVKVSFLLGNDRIFGTAIGKFHLDLDARLTSANDYKSPPIMDELEKMYGDYYDFNIMPMICHVPLDVIHNVDRLSALMFVKKPDFISEDMLFEMASEMANCNDWIDELHMHNVQDSILRYIDHATKNDLLLCRPLLSEEHELLEVREEKESLH